MRHRVLKRNAPRPRAAGAPKSRRTKSQAASANQQIELLDIALNNMSQGLIMFDSSERVVLCNQRYIDISGLPQNFVRPGRTLREILTARQAQGTFSHDIDAYRRALLSDMASGKNKSLVVETSDGRWHRVANVPMSGGGWVATHDDITEQTRGKNVIERQKFHLDAALANMSQGICMFDAAQRLVVCNQQYADIYQLDETLTRPGTPFIALLNHQVAIGNSLGEPDSYLADRQKRVCTNKPYQMTGRLYDGRHISVVHRPLADGGWVATHEDVTETIRREESFRLLFEGSPVPMWVTDCETFRFLAVNEAAISQYGYARDEFMSMTLMETRPPHERESFAEYLRTLSKDDLLEVFTQQIKADGTLIDVCVYSRALLYEGRHARLAAIHDITQTKRTENELKRTKKFLNTVVEHVPLPIIVKDIAGKEDDLADSRFSFFNRAYEELSGDAREQLIGKTAHEIYPKERADLAVRTDIEALQSNKDVVTSEHPIQTAHKGTRLITAKKTVVRDETGKAQYLLTVVDDVTERRQSEVRISYLARTDSLTDLPNRSTFVDSLDEAVARAAKNRERFSILYIDLDRFKETNDIYGHLTGDSLLREAARRLRAVAADAFLARVGGDEFTLIVTQGPHPEAAKAMGDRLLAAFQDAFEVDGHRLQIGLSIGGATYPDDGTDANALLANADAALYQAKTELRGSMRFFEADLGIRLRERRDLESDLRKAIGHSDFMLHYQPQWNIASNEPIGFEALLRWQCPKRGMVSPATFIPVAEESRLIIPLGEWVLREACREAASWPQPLNISVNISPVQFHHGNLPQLVHSILLETGLKPARLELEITEGVLIDDFSRAILLLRQLKSLGVQIAIDDFGSGYSSLSYLHAFPFGKIKIDRGFIRDIETNRQSMAIVRAIITLGRNLDIPVLAEGVETEFQRNFLAQESCDELQGYLAGRPKPIDDYAPLVGRMAAMSRIAAAQR